MKLTGKVDINASAESVFDRLADVTAFGNLIGRKGVASRRTDGGDIPGPGMTWETDFRFRGKDRHMVSQVTRFKRPELLEFDSQTSGFDIAVSVVTVALTPARTRLQVTVEARPRSLGARLLLQSARLGRATLEARFNERIATLGKTLEARSAA